jgi:hypothetical protein
MADEPQPTLSDVLAALVTSISRARVQADVAAVEASRLYRRHELLRGMPVPRIRLNRVQISLPFVVTNIRREERGQLAEPEQIAERITGDLEELLGRVNNLLKDVNAALADNEVIEPGTELHTRLSQLSATLKDAVDIYQMSRNPKSGSYFKFPDMFTAALRTTLSEHAEAHTSDLTSDVDVSQEINRIIVQVMRQRLAIHRQALRKKASEERKFMLECYPLILGEHPAAELVGVPADAYPVQLHQQMLDALPNLFTALSIRAERYIHKTPDRSPEVEITVHTAEVRNEATPATLTRLVMTMSEEGLEWVTDGTEADPNWKLVPE